jgi:hypothetical protein
MRRWLWLSGAILLSLSFYAWKFHDLAKQRGAAEREIGYQRTLDSYLHSVRIGSSRKQVEDFLKSRNVSFGQIYAVEAPSTADDDIVQVGTEESPFWYCGRFEIFVAFEFDAVETHAPYDHLPSDKLKKIIRWGRLNDCL